MAALHVRNVPIEIYQQMQAIAEARGVTLSSFIIELMQEAAEREAARKRHMKAIAAIRRSWAGRPRTSVSGVDLLRDVREEREKEREQA